ncbi:flagellar assembly protein FliH [Pusillimonas noertemannii]|uniref:flagellar assembly protein FliH n=1 Tax=Pusillimonas noertemannii TaxID=305977 RepID=UPI0002F5EACE|nr:flagellar assembly protein FliH [Pusillimonas noertemannii]
MSEPARRALRAYGDQAWRRWEMESVDFADSDEDQPDDAPLALPAHLREEIARLEQQAREEGRAQGHAEGREQGFRQGLEEGRNQGMAEGRAEGFDAGMRDAQEEGRMQNDAQARRLAELLDACSAALHDVEAETGQALVRLAISIAQQVVRSTLAAEPEKILDTLRDILYMDAGQEGLLRLRLHPDDLALVQPHLDDDPAARRWRLQADPGMERGGCVAETALGNIDASLQTRWQRVVGSLGHNLPWNATP